MYNLTTDRLVLHGSLKFARPVYRWREVSEAFLDSLVREFAPDYEPQASHIIVNGGQSLADVSIQYRVLGGGWTITFSAEKLTIDIPSIVNRNESQISVDLLRRCYATILSKPLAIEITSAEINTGEHAGFGSESEYREFQSALRARWQDRPMSVLNAPIQPEFRARSAAPDATWDASFHLEESRAVANGLFIWFVSRISDPAKASNFEASALQFKEIYDGFAAMVAIGSDWRAA